MFILQKKNISEEKNHGNSDTIRIGREIQCLPCAGFLKKNESLCC